jgi:hypothetical protein
MTGDASAEAVAAQFADTATIATGLWNPPWGPGKITDDGRDQLRALGFSA